MRAILAVVLLSGCSAAPRSPAERRSTNAPAPTAGPAATGEPTYARVCVDEERRFQTRAGVSIELAGTTVAPVDYGPRLAESGRPSYPRTLDDVREAFERQEHVLRECWRRARYRTGATHARLAVSMLVGPFGLPSAVRVEPIGAADAELASCARDALRATRVSELVPRRTEVSTELAFEPSGQPLLPLLSPRRTAPVVPRAPAGCLWIRPTLPTDRLESRIAILRIDDRDDDIAERLRLKRRLPKVVIGCATAKPRLDRDLIEHAIQANLGSYRRCYRRARQRTPHLAGTVVIDAKIDGGGAVGDVEISGDPVDREFRACLTRAFEEVWVYPPHVYVVRLRYPLQLDPDATPPDLEAEIAKTMEELARPAPPKDVCAKRLFVARTRGSMYGRGAQTKAALDRLATSIARMSDADATVCLAAAAEIASAYPMRLHVRWQRSGHGGLGNEVVRRYRWLLKRMPRLPNEPTLRFFFADMLWTLGRFDEAADQYRDVSQRPGPYQELARKAGLSTIANPAPRRPPKANRTCLRPARP